MEKHKLRLGTPAAAKRGAVQRGERWREAARGARETGLSLAKTGKSWEAERVKTITLEEIYADPHVLEPLIAAGEPVEITRNGERVGSLTPNEKPLPKKPRVPFDAAKHRAWFLKTHGPDAYKSTRSVEEIMDYVRGERSVSADE
jgi:antitoxin (DNA-binding transcriptional repressor) of toxin-antitoxin stability system